MRAVFFDESGNKPCSKCKRLLTRGDFNVSSKSRSGYASSCKDCMKLSRELNSDKIAEYKRDYYIKNKDVLTEKQKEFRRNNPEASKLADKQKYLKSRDKVLARVSAYAKKIQKLIRQRLRDTETLLQKSKLKKRLNTERENRKLYQYGLVTNLNNCLFQRFTLWLN